MEKDAAVLIGLIAFGAVLAVLVGWLIWRWLGRFSRWPRWSGRVLLVAIAVAAGPTVWGIYQAWEKGVPFSEVSRNLRQDELWIKNLGSKEGAFRTIPVFFGTDRLRNDSDYTTALWQKFKNYFSSEPTVAADRVRFGSGLAKKLTVGEAVVSIPSEAHLRGRVERPVTYTVFDVKLYESPEDPRKHFVITDIGVKSEREFVAAVNKDSESSTTFSDAGFLFVHGYNVSFDAAVYRTAQIAADLGFDGVPLLYSWPSQGEWEDYEKDQNVSEQSQPYLKQFLRLITEKTRIKHLHIVAHSMGNVPLLRVLNELQLSLGARNSLNIEQIILAAPDIDRNVFENLAKSIKPVGRGMTLYASASDRAMQASRIYAGAPRAGDVPNEGPVIVSGVDTVDASRLSMSFLSLNHSDFAEKSQILEDMGTIMSSGTRPPSVRFEQFITINTDNGTYWKY